MTSVLEATKHETAADDSDRESRGTNLYTGTVVHSRRTPVEHRFRFNMFLISIDLDKVDTVFRTPLLCSTGPLSVARFRRADYFGDSKRPLVDCIRELVHQRLGIAITGPIRLLTHLRYFGFVFNPVSFYYCFDSTGERLQAVVAEVTNTPWGERHCYVIPCATDDPVHSFECEKEFHVSPFMPMAMSYVWRLTMPSERLAVQIENHDETGCAFDVALQMQRREFTTARLMWTIVRFPFMTVQVVAAIYWQALRLWWKKIPFVPHPKHRASASTASQTATIQPSGKQH